MINKTALIFISPLVIFLGLFFYWPLANIMKLGILAGPISWQATFQNPLFLRFFSFTLIQALLSVVIAHLIGLPAGYLLARSELYAAKFLRAAITVPFLFPPLVILLGFVLIFDTIDILTVFEFSPFSFWGIIIAHSLYNISLVARISESGFMTESSGFHDVADSLGANWWLKFKDITLPHIKPALLASVLLTFLYSFNSFAIVLILGEVKLQTLEVMIYAQSRLRFNIDTASVLAIFQLLVNLIIILLYVTQSNTAKSYPDSPVIQKIDKKARGTAIVCSITLMTWLPAIMIFRATFFGLRSSTPEVLSQLFGNGYERYLGTSSLRVMGNTVFFGIVVSIIAILLSLSGIVASYYTKNRVVERLTVPLVLLPMGTSAITTSFALLQSHGQFSFFNDLVFIYIISAQLIAALPFASRTIFSSWFNVPTDLLLISDTLGASPRQTFMDVIFPYLKSGLLVAFLFSFAISIGEFGATFYLIRGEWTTLSLAIDKLFVTRNTFLPNLFASILVLMSLIIFWIIEKLGSLELKV